MDIVNTVESQSLIDSDHFGVMTFELSMRNLAIDIIVSQMIKVFRFLIM